MGQRFGIFSQINADSSLSNITVQNANLRLLIEKNEANPYGIFAYSNMGTIENCHVLDCSLRVNSDDGSVTTIAAGFVGSNIEGTIKNCSVSASKNVDTININGKQASGFVIENTTGGIIENCFVTTIVNGGSGFVQNNEGTINNCYSSSKVNQSQTLGYTSGFVGVNTPTGSISNCYAVGSLFGSGSSNSFGFVQSNQGKISNAYAAMDSTTNFVGFGPNTGTLASCYYLNRKTTVDGASSGAGQPLEYGQMNLDNMSLGDAWEAPTAERSHPFNTSLGTYPFPILTTIDHYGNWVGSETAAITAAYYQAEPDGSYRLFAAGLQLRQPTENPAVPALVPMVYQGVVQLPQDSPRPSGVQLLVLSHGLGQGDTTSPYTRLGAQPNATGQLQAHKRGYKVFSLQGNVLLLEPSHDLAKPGQWAWNFLFGDGSFQIKQKSGDRLEKLTAKIS